MNDVSAWVAAVVSLIGAALAYVGARQGSRPDRDAVTESRRDEWGRRFSTAIDLMIRPGVDDRAMGRALLDALFESDLATADDRRIAQRLLEASVLAAVPVSTQRELEPRPAGLTPSAVDDIEFVEDDGGSTTAASEEGR